VEEIARLFHEIYERLAPEFGYKTREESAVPWEDVPEPNQMLMKSTVAEVIEKANLIPLDKIWACSECGDSGNILDKYIGDDLRLMKPCTCQKSATSIYSIRKQARKSKEEVK
jgi:hypothetical protein